MNTKGEITMLFKITKASYYTNEWSFNERLKDANKPCKNAVLNDAKEWVVEINTLEDLLAIRNEVSEELVIGLNDTITVYDDFME